MMNHSTRVVRRARPSMLPTAAAVIAAAVLALLAAACGSGSPAGPGGPSNAGRPPGSPSAVAYSRCMRSHGVSQFPDPGRAGIVPVIPTEQAGQFGISPSKLLAAEHACQALVPPPSTKLTQKSLAQCMVDQDCPPALVQQALVQLRKFSRCMRSHGVPNWPDPTIGSDGGPLFPITGQDGIDLNSSQIQDKMNQCEHVEHPVLGEPVGS